MMYSDIELFRIYRYINKVLLLLLLLLLFNVSGKVISNIKLFYFVPRRQGFELHCLIKCLIYCCTIFLVDKLDFLSLFV